MNIPDEAVEAVARRNYEAEWGDGWDGVIPNIKRGWLNEARAQCEAAAPHMMAGLRAELVRLAKEFDTAEGGTLAYTTAVGPHLMRKNAHDQLMYIIGDHLGTPHA